MAAFNPWETEAMASYSSPLKMSTLPPRKPTLQEEHEPEQPEGEPSAKEETSALVAKQNDPNQETEESDKDWVIVEKPESSIRERKWTREMTDTEFHRVFRVPLTHSFGRGNTSPMRNEDYFKTFNVKAPKEGVYTSSLRSNPRRTATRSRPRPPTPPVKVDRSVGTANKNSVDSKAREVVPKVDPIIEKDNERNSDKDSDSAKGEEQDPAKSYLRGDPRAIFNCVVKSRNTLAERRATQLSMFEALSWPLPEEEVIVETDKASKDLTLSSKDPKNYAYVDPKAIDIIDPAGFATPKSQPIVRLS